MKRIVLFDVDGTLTKSRNVRVPSCSKFKTPCLNVWIGSDKLLMLGLLEAAILTKLPGSLGLRESKKASISSLRMGFSLLKIKNKLEELYLWIDLVNWKIFGRRQFEKVHKLLLEIFSWHRHSHQKRHFHWVQNWLDQHFSYWQELFPKRKRWFWSLW